MSYNKIYSKTKSINKLINEKISNNKLENKLFYSNINNKDKQYESESDNDNDIELELLEKELTAKTSNNTMVYPKNYGNFWSDKERKVILKNLNKNQDKNHEGLFDETSITKIAQKIERTEHAVKEEIKKMIFNDFINGYDYSFIENKFNTKKKNNKIIIKSYLEKNGKKIINLMETENKIISLQLENIKLKKELFKLQKT